MYQKCPLCNGIGIDQTSAFTSKDITCPACNGQKIIDEVTGEPPNQVDPVCACTCPQGNLCEFFKKEKCLYGKI